MYGTCEEIRRDFDKQEETFACNLDDLYITCDLLYGPNGQRRRSCLNVFRPDDELPIYSATFSGNDCDFKAWACFKAFERSYIENGCKIPENWTWMPDDSAGQDFCDLSGEFDYLTKDIPETDESISVATPRYYTFMATAIELCVGWRFELDQLCLDKLYGVAYSIHGHDHVPHVHFIVMVPHGYSKEQFEDDFRKFNMKNHFEVHVLTAVLDYMTKDGDRISKLFVDGPFNAARDFAAKRLTELW